MPNFSGQWGQAAIEWYAANSLWINLIVLVYGLWIVLSWVNLKTIRNYLLQFIIQQLQAAPGEKAAKVSREELAASMPWESAIQQGRFPFVAQQMALIPRRKTLENVRALLPGDGLVEDAEKFLKLAAKKKRKK
jgi:hypothetical protein